MEKKEQSSDENSKVYIFSAMTICIIVNFKKYFKSYINW